MNELITGKILVLNLKVMKQPMNILLININDLVDLEKRLLKNKTIDKNVQEQINREKDHWKRVLLRIIVE
jgi:hypothetical protein